jgi:hypothetical protein
MNGPTIVWGTVADQYGYGHWSGVEAETLPDGRFVAHRVDEWATEPVDAYAPEHPVPMRWCHDEDIGRVLALRRMDGKLFAVAECQLSPADLDALTVEHGDLRWPTGTRRVGRGPLVLRECSLTSRPASVGLHPVRWHRAGVSLGNVPEWVAADVERGRRDMNRRRDVLEVYERTGHWLATEREAAAAHERDLERRRADGHNPNEIHYSSGGYVVAVGGRPVRRR